MPVPFKCQFFLDSDALCVMEIKWEHHFQWLLINKVTLAIQPLKFRSMDTSDQVEERFFDLGYLKFDLSQGVFIEKFNSGQHTLENRGNKDVPHKYIEAVSAYLSVTNAELT